MSRGIWWCCFVIGAMAPASGWAGKLADTGETVSQGDDHDDDDDGCVLICFILELLGEIDVDGQPESDLQESTVVSFLPFPYAKSYSGYRIARHRIVSVASGAVHSAWTDPHGGKLSDGAPWAARFEADYQFDWDGVHLTTVLGRMESSSGFGFAGRWTGFFEPVENKIDRLQLFELSVFYDVLSASKVKLELSGGGLAMAYDGALYWGGVGRMHLDVFPVRPLVISSEIAVGGINATLYFRSRVSLGAAIRRIELFAGYDVQRFGTADPIVYHGPIIGLRIWL